MESKEDWISAAAALALLKPALTTYTAQMAICNRAHSGLIRARAVRYVRDGKAADNAEVPALFWWAEGHQALEQDWVTGDFSTFIESGSIHLQAFGVTFARADIGKLLPADAATAAADAATAAKGGRPPADWWDDLWIEICRQLYVGELIPKKQADIEGAMKEWLATRGEHPSDSTIRPRARKLWEAIKREGEN